MSCTKKPVYCQECFIQYGVTDKEYAAWHSDKLSLGLSRYAKPCSCCGKVGSVVTSKRILKN